MNCMACGRLITRRYFTQKYNGKDVILCPVCNKQWSNIKARLDELTAAAKAMAEVKQQPVKSSFEIIFGNDEGVEK